MGEAPEVDGKECLVMELLSGGEMFDLILEHGRLEESVARFYFQQLLDAVEHMHSLGYAHRDIKLENIVLDRDQNLKLIDLAFASQCNCKTRDVKPLRRGTPGYLSPEMLQKSIDACFKEQDLFAVGVCLFTMVVGAPPFKEATKENAQYGRLFRSARAFWDGHPRGRSLAKKQLVSEELIDLVCRMLDPVPERRLSIEQIRNHPWTRQTVHYGEAKLEMKQRQLNMP